jgi:hypothetical protein
VGITALDRTGPIVFANLAAGADFGMERGEVEVTRLHQPDWYLTDTMRGVTCRTRKRFFVA